MTFPLSHFKTFPAIAWCIALAGLNCALPAAAESPMHTDDAGTLAQGGVKLEAVAFRDDKTRGVDVVVGGQAFSRVWRWKLCWAAPKTGSTSPLPPTGAWALG